ncbi:MAG: hypothetical protein M3167_14275 [Acidobacteriota bacterium]|nr:hypothetical protein [Acidobacteriota bacterium]
MILYEEAPAPAVRAGELDLAGRRIAARAFAYSGETGPPAFRFDPAGRRLHGRSPSGVLLAGPAEAERWREAFARVPPGPVLIQGAASAEEIRGSFRAAAEGARAAGRGAYLLDPEPAGLPRHPAPASGRPSAVALFCWSPAAPLDVGSLSAAQAAGIPGGVVWPLIPGWTAGEDFWAGYLDGAAKAGAEFAVPLAPVADAEFRRIAVEARARVSPGDADRFFETMHHLPWSEALPEMLLRARAAVRDRGLTAIPPRPAGLREPLANSGAAARLEERALDVGIRDEHHSSLLLAAVRWIDACGRDLRPILLDGNFARAFPFGRDLARETEEAIREAAG